MLIQWSFSSRDIFFSLSCILRFMLLNLLSQFHFLHPDFTSSVILMSLATVGLELANAWLWNASQGAWLFKDCHFKFLEQLEISCVLVVCLVDMSKFPSDHGCQPPLVYQWKYLPQVLPFTIAPSLSLMVWLMITWGLLGGSVGKEPTCQCRRWKRWEFDS